MTISRNRQVSIEQDVKTAPLAFFMLALYTTLALIRPHEFSPETAQYQLIRYAAIAAFVFLLFSLRPIKISSQTVMLLLLVPLVMVSAFLNGWGGGGILQAQRLFISSIIPFFLYSVLVCTPTRQRILMIICMFAALAMVINAYYQRASFDGTLGVGVGGSTTVGGEEMRITYLGFFNDPNDVGMFLVMNIPFAAYFFVRSGFVIRLLMITFTSALAYGIYATGSRGTLLSSLGIVVTYLLMKRAGGKLILFLAITAPVAATLIASFGGLGVGDGSVDGRLDAWYEGIQMLIHNPVFGVGMGNFIEEHIRVAHNSYIHVAAELGVPGYSLWGGVLVLNMLASYHLIKGKVPAMESSAKEDQLNEELLLNHTMFFSMIGFMTAAFFLSRNYVLTMFIFMGIQTASLMRIVAIAPSFQEEFSRQSIFKAMGLAWIIIVAVYISLKLGL